MEGGLHTPMPPFGLQHAFPLQHVVDAGLRGNGLIGKTPGEQCLYLLRAERFASLATQFDHRLAYGVGYFSGCNMGPAAAFFQPCHAFSPVALHPFVTRLAADAVAFAKLDKTACLAQVVGYKQYLLVHRFHISPWHRNLLSAVPTEGNQLLPMSLY